LYSFARREARISEGLRDVDPVAVSHESEHLYILLNWHEQDTRECQSALPIRIEIWILPNDVHDHFISHSMYHFSDMPAQNSLLMLVFDLIRKVEKSINLRAYLLQVGKKGHR